MNSIRILTHDQFAMAVKYCENYISPRQYWLHNKVGGDGWYLYLNNIGWYLQVTDTKHLTFFTLTQ